MKKAAQRHLAFSYREIAEYYAAASKPMQELMEASALVVIDFDDAVKHGYVEMTKTLQELKAFEGVEALIAERDTLKDKINSALTKEKEENMKLRKYVIVTI